MFFFEKRFQGCIATHRNAFVIGPEGEVYKCQNDVGNPEMVVGNIVERNWNLSLYTKYMIGVDPFSDPDLLLGNLFVKLSVMFFFRLKTYFRN